MKVDVVICDHGSAAEGTDSGHLKSLLKGMGYRVMYVPRCYSGLYDVAAISVSGAGVILADPSVRNGGNRMIDSSFLKGLEDLCQGSRASLVLFASNPQGLGRQDVIDKKDHPLIIETIDSYFTVQPS